MLAGILEDDSGAGREVSYRLRTKYLRRTGERADPCPDHDRQHPSQIALAEFAGTDVKMTSQVVRSLERKDLVEREINPADSRARRLKVTRRGARLAPRAIDVVQEIDAAFFREIPPVEGLGLLRELARFPLTAATGKMKRCARSKPDCGALPTELETTAARQPA